MGPSLRAVLSAALAAVISACSARDDDGLGSALRDRTFVSESVEGQELVAGTEVRIRFGDGELTASAGCNLMDGAYSIRGGVLRMHGIGMTEMGCDPARHAQDDWVADFLQAEPRLALVEPRLVMTTPEMRMTLIDREVASPDRPLVGTAWTGEAFINGDSVGIAVSMTEVSALFAPDGSVTIDTSCQIGTGAYQVESTRIVFQGLAYDGSPCADAAHQSVHGQVLLVLDGADVTFEIEEKRLVLMKGSLGLGFRAAN